jgi:hypothetical protein
VYAGILNGQPLRAAPLQLRRFARRIHNAAEPRPHQQPFDSVFPEGLAQTPRRLSFRERGVKQPRRFRQIRRTLSDATKKQSALGRVSKIRKAHFRRLDMHIFVEKPRRSTTAPAFFASICKQIPQNCIF